MEGGARAFLKADPPEKPGTSWCNEFPCIMERGYDAVLGLFVRRSIVPTWDINSSIRKQRIADPETLDNTWTILMLLGKSAVLSTSLDRLMDLSTHSIAAAKGSNRRNIGPARLSATATYTPPTTRVYCTEHTVLLTQQLVPLPGEGETLLGHSGRHRLRLPS